MSNSITFDILGNDKSGSSSLNKVADTAESSTSRISGLFGKLGNVVGGEVGDLLNKVSEGFSSLSEKGDGVGKSLAAIGGIVTGLGVGLQTLASGDQQAQAQLKTAISDTGGAWSDYSDQVEKAIDKGASYGHGAADVQNALSAITEATNSPNAALQDMNVTMDLAAAKHESLTSAAQQLAKVYGGNTKLLKQFGIDVKVSAGDTDEANAAITQLAAKLNGQASASVDSFTGRLKVWRAELTNDAATIGKQVGPILTAVGPVLMIVGTGYDLLAARAKKAAAAQVLSADATKGQGDAAGASVAENDAAAASQVKLGDAAEDNAEKQDGSKLASAGAAGALTALAVGGYVAGKAISDLVEKGNLGAQEMGKYKATVEALTSAMMADGGAIGANTENLIASQLQQDGFASRAAKSGITLAQLTTAVSGTDAQFAALAKTWQASGKPSGDTLAGLGLIHAAMGQASGSAKTLTTAQQQLAANETATADAATAQATATAAATAESDALSKAMSLTTSMGTQLSDTLDGLSGNAIDAAKQEDTFRDSLTGITAAVKTNGTAINDSTTGGRANKEMLLDMITAANQHAEAVYKQTGSISAATSALSKDQVALRASATAAGLNKDQVNALVKQYAAVPKTVSTTVTANVEAAFASLDNVADRLAFINGLSPEQFHAMEAALAAQNTGPSESAQRRATAMASGGIIPATPGGRLVRAAEAGSDEAFLPLDRLPALMRKASPNGGSGGPTVHLTMPLMYGANADAVARQILSALQRLKGGGTPTHLG